MKKSSKKKLGSLIRPWIVNVVGVFIGVFFVTIMVYGATTIGDNINTGGNLDVDGRTSTTNATTTGYLYVGGDITEPTGWDFGVGDLIVADDVFFNGQATTSASLWIGTGGTASSTNMAGGDLFVQDDVEIEDDIYIKGGTFSLSTGTPTTTAGLFVGATSGRGTTTVGVGHNGQVGCIELGGFNRGFFRVYVDSAGTGLIVQAGRCTE